MKVVALAGGTGSAKLLRGLSKLRVDLRVVVNVGDDVWMHGLFVCPDLDTAMYTLARTENRDQGWGIEADTYETLTQLETLGEETWFRLGDRDLATHILRTKYLRAGMSLTKATETLCKSFGVSQAILPASNDPVETHILTPHGSVHLQEFWVRDHGRPRVKGVVYEGAAKARPTKETARAIEEADRVVICPANPVSSIGSILALPGLGEMLSATSARVGALSPMIGRVPFSGPAEKLMRAVGMRTDSVGVAGRYSEFLDFMIIDKSDAAMKQEVERTGVACRLSDTRMRDARDEGRLARELLEA